MSKAKHWVFTLNNWTQDDVDRLEALHASGDASYIVFGEEVGESGTEHLQGYACFASRKTLAQAKRLIGSRAHLEVMRGTPQQASEYCKKDESYHEFGEIPAGQGSRTDLGDLIGAIRSGKSMRELEDEFPGECIRYDRAVLRRVAEARPFRTEKPYVHVLWGDTGVGKTRYVFDRFDWEDIYVYSGGKWFDGYVGQSVALFDDFTGSEFKLGFFLRLLDRYPMRVEIKGGFVQWNPSKIFITSNKPVGEWYPNAFQKHREALDRRIDERTHMTNE
jgi:hypothetical protein